MEFIGGKIIEVNGGFSSTPWRFSCRRVSAEDLWFDCAFGNQHFEHVLTPK